MINVTSQSRLPHLPLRSVSAGVVLVMGLSACSALNDFVGGDKVDYRGAAARTRPLEVPPDLTQLSNDTRYQPSAVRGAVSANEFQAGASAPTAGSLAGVAPQAIGDTRIERLGAQRYLVTPVAPEQLWPQLQAFWQERNLALVVDKPEVGVMETEWAENRAKLPADFLRRTVGRVLDVFYSTNTLDKFRVRVERASGGTGSEIYLTHQGMEEFFGGPQKDQAVWEARPRDPQLEGEILSLMMIKLGVPQEQAKAAVQAPAPEAPPARARALADRPGAAMQVDDGFDRAWRRVGLALDRSGFTVEDRDRAQGVYFVRYVDPASAGREEPGFFSRIFGGDKKKADNALVRYRVNVIADGDRSTVQVLDAAGNPEQGEAGQRIVRFLVDELK